MKIIPGKRVQSFFYGGEKSETIYKIQIAVELMLVHKTNLKV